MTIVLFDDNDDSDDEFSMLFMVLLCLSFNFRLFFYFRFFLVLVRLFDVILYSFFVSFLRFPSCYLFIFVFLCVSRSVLAPVFAPALLSLIRFPCVGIALLSVALDFPFSYCFRFLSPVLTVSLA